MKKLFLVVLMLLFVSNIQASLPDIDIGTTEVKEKVVKQPATDLQVMVTQDFTKIQHPENNKNFNKFEQLQTFQKGKQIIYKSSNAGDCLYIKIIEVIDHNFKMGGNQKVINRTSGGLPAIQR